MRLRQAYYACVSYVDAQVGRLLDALNALDLNDNTIVVLMGDHGYSLGEADHWCKATNFELDTRVPLIIRKPNITDPGVPTSALVESVDLYPTLLDLLKLKSPNRLDGESLIELLNNPKAQGKPAVLSQFARPFKPSEPSLMGYSLRTANMRYTRWVDWENKQIKSEELYQYSDLDEHSSTENRFTEHAFVEQENILNQHPEQAAQMRDALTEMLDRRIAKVSTIEASSMRTQKKKNP
jgi:iduronate 2-sulfatase